MLTIYKASAGSGKTFTLAYEYIKLLLGLKRGNNYVLNDGTTTGGTPLPNRHRAILAITFTKAATAEMKDRIIGKLNELANIADKPRPKETEYVGMLQKEFGCSRKALRSQAQRALRDLLNDYGRFNVSTIDSFFQSVLRTFAREIDFQGDYDLAMNRYDIIMQSVGEMFDDLGMQKIDTSDRIYRWLESQTRGRLQKGETFNMFQRDGSIIAALSKGMNDTLNESFTEEADSMRAFIFDEERVERFRRALDKERDRCFGAITEAARNFLEACRFHDVEASLKKAYATRTLKFATRSEDIDSSDFTLQPFKDHLAQPDRELEVPLTSALPAALVRKLDAEVAAMLEAKLSIMLATALNMYNRVRVLDEMKKSVQNLEFISIVQSAVENYLRQTNTMLMTDTVELLGKIISDRETPFIYERLGVELESLLIDEFQDTSRLQWKNLRPLVLNSIDQSNDSLIIGDVKQAIYRWRNSDPSLLGRAVGEDLRIPPSHRNVRGDKEADNTNFRSSHQIVRFNNTLFRRLATMLDIDGYQGVVQKLQPRLADVPGYVRVEISKGLTDRLDRQDNAKDDHNREILSRMARDIRRQHNDGYNWRDILILVRTNAQATDIVTIFLEQYPDIPILSNEALMLSNSPAVRCAMSMLELVERTRTIPTKNNDGSDPYLGKESINDFNNLCRLYASDGTENSSAIIRALMQVRENGGDLTIVEKVRRRNPANIVGLLEEIIKELPEEMHRTEQAYLGALQDRALEHCQSARPSVKDFVDKYRRNASNWAIQAAEGLDSVRIMTIHGSKGLERACVHIPMAAWIFDGTDRTTWLRLDNFTTIDPNHRPPMIQLPVSVTSPVCDPAVMPELAPQAIEICRQSRIDNINLAYVAFTRARRELIVHAARTRLGTQIEKALLQEHTETHASELIDIKAHTRTDDQDTLILTIGQPTKPHISEPEPESELRRTVTDTAAPYNIVDRDDSREFINVDDILSDDILTGDEYSQAAKDFAEDTPESMAAARRGNAMHAILANITVPADLDSAVEAAAAAGYATPDEAAHYRTILTKAVEASRHTVESWFRPDAKVYAERSIFDPHTGKTYRPDRVVLMPEGHIAVIDYKFTAKEEPEHTVQVSRYVSLIEQIEPYPAKAYLWYPLIGKIVEC